MLTSFDLWRCRLLQCENLELRVLNFSRWGHSIHKHTIIGYAIMENYKQARTKSYVSKHSDNNQLQANFGVI